MSRQQLLRLHTGLVAGCAFIALALLVTFYSVVSGAVTHAAVRRTAMSSAVFEGTSAHLPSLRKARPVFVAGAAD